MHIFEEIFLQHKNLNPSNNTSIYAYFLNMLLLHFKEAIFSPRKKTHSVLSQRFGLLNYFLLHKNMHPSKIKSIYTIIIALISPRIYCKTDAQLQAILPTMAHKNTCLWRQSAITPRVNSSANFR